MKVCFINPRPQLRPYVEAFWTLESAFGLPQSDFSTAAPNGCPKLIIPCENSIVSVADGRVSESGPDHSYFVGNRDSSTRLYTSRRSTSFLAVEFKPYAAYPLFGLPMSETSNGLWETDSVFGKWGHEFTERIRSLPTLRQKVACVQDHLVRLLLRHGRGANPIVVHCVDAIRASSGRITVADLQRSTGYSRRYLDLLFQREVGIAPKALAGISRFQKFYRQWASGESFDQLKTQLYDHYYDQAHFSKEFQKMTGHSPARFMRDVSNEFGRRINTA